MADFMMVHLSSNNAELILNRDFVVSAWRINETDGEYTQVELHDGKIVTITEEPAALVLGRPKTP